MAQTIVKVTGLNKFFGSGSSEVRAVKDVNLDLKHGEMVLIMGPSGSGKTTLLSMIGGLLRPTSGDIIVDGMEITSLEESHLSTIRAEKIGFVFQAFNLLEALTVEENILFPLRATGKSLADSQEYADNLIARLGLEQRRNALPRTLSGGEKQRVAIARALINNPMLILADEPTGNLDSSSGQEVMMILHDIVRDEGRTVIMVTHDPRVEEVTDRVLWLEDGMIRDRKSEHHKWSRDPVCGMHVDEWTAEFKLEHEHNTYVFCSVRCQQRFIAEPGKYINRLIE